MPTYDYRCKNEECGNPGEYTKFCNATESRVLPICDSCGSAMPKVFLAMPSVSWIYYNPSGHRRTSSMGPAQRADRRHNGWNNGVKQLKPIYNSRPSRRGRKVDLGNAEKKED